MHSPQPNPVPGQPLLLRYRHFVIGAAIYLLLVQCATLLIGIPRSLSGFGDFRTFYSVGYMVRTGDAHHLYDRNVEEQVQERLVPTTGIVPFLYPAAYALIFVPLSLLSWKSAYALFFVINLLLLWLALRLMLPHLQHLSGYWKPLPFALFFCAPPAADVLFQGQTSFFLLLLYCAAFVSLQAGKPFRAGICIGLAIMKMQIALPVVLLFLLWRQWRVVAGFLAGSAVPLAGSLWVVGWTTFLAYWRWLLLTASDARLKGNIIHVRAGSMPNFHSLAQILFGESARASLVSIFASVLLLLWIGFKGGMFEKTGASAVSESTAMKLLVALVTSLLVSRYMYGYDLVLLTLPIAVVLNRAVADLRAASTRRAAVCALVLVFPVLYLRLSGPPRFCWIVVPILAFLACLTGLPPELRCDAAEDNQLPATRAARS